jgi:hypothetical protein
MFNQLKAAMEPLQMVVLKPQILPLASAS